MLTTTRSWEYGMRLGAILNEVDGVNVSSHSYTYDNLNRRTAATLEDGSHWQYGYNDRNEVTSAARSWSDQTLAAGQQFGYDYDCIGNRKTAQSGGDTNGANLRPTGYAVNSLNQYTTITNQGYADILGVALATNTVWVNNSVAERKGEYFRKELAVGNASGPVWTNVTVASGGTTNTGGLIVPDNEQALTYDLDGNLTFDGTWSYTWDGENRLRTMTMTTNVAGIANSNILKLEFTYDYQGRRVEKVVKRWDGSGFGNTVTTRFVYDGWNLLAILDSQSSLLQSFTWGQDLSGTMQEAGGIGGLLLVTYHTSPAISAFAGYDGNGNVAVLVDADALFAVARYEYSPFGETLRATGPLAKLNPFRFSTKFADDQSGLLFYGERYFSPALGRFVSRDPIEEEGGQNLYAMALNNLINSYDALGERTLVETGTAAAGAAALGMGGTILLGSIYQELKATVAQWNAGQLAIAMTSSSDPNDDMAELMAALGATLAGQLANMLPDPDDDGHRKDPRRSQKGGSNQAQNKLAKDAAKEARLNTAGREELKRLLEDASRGSKGTDNVLSYQDILRIAKELAQSAKFRLP